MNIDKMELYLRNAVLLMLCNTYLNLTYRNQEVIRNLLALFQPEGRVKLLQIAVVIKT
jgi:hypothetical protein